MDCQIGQSNEGLAVDIIRRGGDSVVREEKGSGAFSVSSARSHCRSHYGL